MDSVLFLENRKFTILPENFPGISSKNIPNIASERILGGYPKMALK